MATIKDIARIAGVAPSVVSRALNNKYGVKESTRQRIVEIAREFGYYPNSAARSLVTRRTETIGVVMADISEPYIRKPSKGWSSWRPRRVTPCSFPTPTKTSSRAGPSQDDLGERGRRPGDHR